MLKSNILSNQNKGSILFYREGLESIINYENLTISKNNFSYIVRGDFVIFIENFHNIEFTYKGLNEDSSEYEPCAYKNIKKPFLILHKKYIHDVYLNSNIYPRLHFKPSKMLYIEISSYTDSQYLEIKEYLSQKRV